MDLLIIDDDIVDRMAAVRTLKETGLQLREVRQTASSAEGIALALAGDYDAILLDYQLPPSNGIEVLRELRGSSDFSTAIVMLSNSHDEELALRCIEAGAQDFLMKSEVTASRLKRAVLLATERHQLERQIRDNNEQLRRLTECDNLTGLTNRYFFEEALKDALIHAEREQRELALIFIDIDRFKTINDSYGHDIGDALLRAVSRRLEKVVGKDDKLCRIGGDEFAILTHALTDINQVRPVVEGVSNSLAAPLDVDGTNITISTSIGVATYPDCATDATGLMRSADVATYRAKTLGRNQVQYYSHDFHQQMQYRHRIESDLKAALVEQQFSLYYQPQVDAKTYRLVGIEALIRWHHPELGMIPPDEFIPIAEESDVINRLGRWVLTTACQQFSQWLQLPHASELTFSIAANLSARQLKDAGLVQHLTECMQRYQVPAERLELELTESCLESSLDALDMLQQLSGIGVNLALDDFGTGYSSLSYLKKFPFNILKIDKLFVQHSEEHEQANLLHAICSFAHSLGYETVAEGIETEAQRDMCSALGIKRLQGYYFARPMPADELQAQWLTHGR